MFLTKSDVYNQDITRISNNFNFSKLENKSIFITGCNGLICSCLVDVIWKINIEKKLNIKLILATRNIEKTKNRFLFWNNKNISLVLYDATKPIIEKYNYDYFILGASNASPDLFMKEPVETMNSNIFGTNEILKSIHNPNAKILYISSSEVYGLNSSGNPLKETDYGFIDILNHRSSYGISKRASETLCISYINEYNKDIIIARPGHIYGPTASKNDKRVSSSFMYDSQEGKNIILKSKGNQLRSYTYCLDCASALLIILLFGITGEAYNISNPNSICTIADMAKAFAMEANTKLLFELPKEDESKAFNPMLNSSLNSNKLENLNWKSLFSQEEGFSHSIKILNEILK